ncbi:MAG: hypothetical protein OXE92_03705 [Bacteroidetes bacterium]|nr:hypothetical protein [Bacteroidota bacterium]
MIVLPLSFRCQGREAPEINSKSNRPEGQHDEKTYHWDQAHNPYRPAPLRATSISVKRSPVATKIHAQRIILILATALASCRGNSSVIFHVARSVFLLSAVFEGWTASAILSAPITAVEHAVIRPCEDDVCVEVIVSEDS